MNKKLQFNEILRNNTGGEIVIFTTPSGSNIMNTAVCNSNVGVIWLDVENWHFNDVCVLKPDAFFIWYLNKKMKSGVLSGRDLANKTDWRIDFYAAWES